MLISGYFVVESMIIPMRETHSSTHFMEGKIEAQCLANHSPKSTQERRGGFERSLAGESTCLSTPSPISEASGRRLQVEVSGGKVTLPLICIWNHHRFWSRNAQQPLCRQNSSPASFQNIYATVRCVGVHGDSVNCQEKWGRWGPLKAHVTSLALQGWGDLDTTFLNATIIFCVSLPVIY